MGKHEETTRVDLSNNIDATSVRAAKLPIREWDLVWESYVGLITGAHAIHSVAYDL